MTPPKAVAKAKTKAAKTKTSPVMKRVEDILDKDTLSEKIMEMKAEQSRAKAERAKLAKLLRNTERRKTRLRSRAKLLTDEDLLQVLMMRKDQRDARPSLAPSATGAAASGLTEDERPIA